MPVRQTLQEGHHPVLVWTDELEASARAQPVNLSRLPVIHHPVAAMPDVHTGIGATVGTVIATRLSVSARVWVTRKGAIHANQGELGIIPGSMGARSYIVRGKGCAAKIRGWWTKSPPPTRTSPR